MTAPTDRQGIVCVIASVINMTFADQSEVAARQVLAALDAFAVIVPREPTEEMTEDGWIDTEGVTPRDIFIKMIAASPFAPKVGL